MSLVLSSCAPLMLEGVASDFVIFRDGSLVSGSPGQERCWMTLAAGGPCGIDLTIFHLQGTFSDMISHAYVLEMLTHTYIHRFLLLKCETAAVSFL